tara:strand:- start:99 stop:287 length:189 start_codon:yes stop_codon:yes gene_type:complete
VVSETADQKEHYSMNAKEEFFEKAREILGAKGLINASEAAKFLSDITGTGLTCLFVAQVLPS